MARAALLCGVSEPSKQSSVRINTIKRIESENRVDIAIPANIRLIIATLEASGIETVGTRGEGRKVCL